MKAWPIFFSSAWGRFERHFGALITNITKMSDLIDKQATTYHILEVKEWRQKSIEDSVALETRRATEQLQAVLNWLGTEVQTQKDKLDWLNARSHEGTSAWIARNTKFRSWLQRGRGSPLLWIHGKPGSGQSFVSIEVPCQLRVLIYDARQICLGITGRIVRARRPKEQSPSSIFLLRLPHTSSSGHDSDFQDLSSPIHLAGSRYCAVSL